MSILSSLNNINPKAQSVASQGRFGDNNLLHVSDQELAALNSTGKLTINPQTGLPEAFSLGSVFHDIGSAVSGGVNTLGSILGGHQARSDIKDLAGQGIQAGDPLQAAQRQPYQQQLFGLIGPGQTGAQDFLSTDPTVQAQKNMIGDWAQKNFAHSGNMTNTAITGSAQLANVFGNQLNSRIQQLLMAGGFPMQQNAAGQIYGSAMNPMTQSNMQTQNTLGSILGMGAGMMPGMGGIGGGGGGGGGGMAIDSILGGGGTGGGFGAGALPLFL